LICLTAFRVILTVSVMPSTETIMGVVLMGIVYPEKPGADHIK
jgi:hypothetical protein